MNFRNQVKEIPAKKLSVEADLYCAFLSEKAVQDDWENAGENQAWKSLKEITTSD